MHTYILTKGLVFFIMFFSSLHTLIFYGTVLHDIASSSTDVVSNNHYNEMGELNPHFHFTRPECSGGEYRITDCQYNNNTADLSNYEDWVVYCIVGK